MAMCPGIVKDKMILLPEDVHLEQGTAVEVRVYTPNPGVQGSNDASEEAFLQSLLEEGLIKEIKRPSKVPPPGDRTSIKVKGKPLSLLIIEDRR